ncbi:MAG: lipoprotein [Pseudomonadota bacterium]
MADRWFLLLILTGLVATCGQKGPLEPPPRLAALHDPLHALVAAGPRS